MRHSTYTLVLATALGLGTTACGALAELDAAADALAGDEYTAAIPSQQMLALTTEAHARAEAGARAEGDLAGRGREAMQEIDELRAEVHAALRAVVEEATPAVITRGSASCKAWTTVSTGVQWQLLSCQVEGSSDLYSFALAGRHEGTVEGDFLPVLAGQARRLPDYLGERRGAGRVGYNFDNFAALAGVEAGGQLGIGYRVAGRVRQIELALRDVHGAEAEQSTTARFRYAHEVHGGGRFVFATGADVLAHTAAEVLAAGQDGLDELVRVAMAWNAEGEARALAVACGGTVGEGICVSVAQCASADGSLRWGDVSVGEASWSSEACAAVEVGEVGSPEEPATETDESGAPVVEEPAPSADE